MGNERRPTATLILIVAMAIVLALPVLYVLSMGPAYASDHVSSATYNYVYRPVNWLANGTPLGDVLRAYVQWWKGD